MALRKKSVVFGRVKPEALFPQATEVKLWSENCILNKPNPQITALCSL
jgi:hypothetical protein